MPDTPSEVHPGSLGEAWASRSSELARWALARLVNRADAWGAYHPDGGQVTRRGRLEIGRLARHFRAVGPADVLGLHTAAADNGSKGGALDIDQHGPDDPARAEANRRAALHWHDELTRRGFRPLLTESNGRGGYHLRVLLAEPIDASRVRHLLRGLAADHRQHGLAQPPEVFPKQDDVRRCDKGLGNWLRVPGRHYKRAFWSRVWDGGRWLDGPAAVEFLLALPGDDPALVPPPPPPAAPRRPRGPAPAGGNLSARIAAYLARLPNLTAGQGRDDVAYRFAAWLVRDLALDDAAALAWLERWDAGNAPPKGRDRLAAILKNARAYGQRPVGRDPGRAGPAGVPRIVPAGRPGHYVLRVTAEIW